MVTEQKIYFKEDIYADLRAGPYGYPSVQQLWRNGDGPYLAAYDRTRRMTGRSFSRPAARVEAIVFAERSGRAWMN